MTNNLFNSPDVRTNPTPTFGLLKRMNSAFIGYLVSSKKRGVRSDQIPDMQKIDFHRATNNLTEPSRRLPHHQFRRDLAMMSRDLAFLEHAVNALENNAHCVRAHRFHGLAHGGERRGAE